MTRSAKVYTREIFQDLLSAKVYAREKKLELLIRESLCPLNKKNSRMASSAKVCMFKVASNLYQVLK